MTPEEAKRLISLGYEVAVLLGDDLEAKRFLDLAMFEGDAIGLVVCGLLLGQAAREGEVGKIGLLLRGEKAGVL